MKKLTSTKYSIGAFNTGMLILRIFGGILLMSHGYDKLVDFEKTTQYMPSFMGMGSTTTTVLVIFAEFFCALFVVLGLFTRIACIPIIINMGYIVLITKGGNVFEKGGDLPAVYLALFLAILLVGPGRISVDGMTGK